MGQVAKNTAGIPVVEQLQYCRGPIDLRFLLNRKHRTLQVFDLKVGEFRNKRDCFDLIADTQGLRKVFTVVEQRDSRSWRSVGFSAEGAIPGYFRMADGHIMSRVYEADGDPVEGGAPKLVEPIIDMAPTATRKPQGLQWELVEEPRTLERLTRRMGDKALYAPFRRGMPHPNLGLRARHGERDYFVGAEINDSFAWGKIDLFTPPAKAREAGAMAFCVRALLDELTRRDMMHAFALCAADSPLPSRLFARLGFAVTARLVDHVMREDGPAGALLWHLALGET